MQTERKIDAFMVCLPVMLCSMYVLWHVRRIVKLNKIGGKSIDLWFVSKQSK
jgi:hypothetical protein